ncbi:MAG: phosphoribosylanthranilate isomerase [Patescibacteria group bacterium]
MIVKICGIRTEEAARTAVEAGAGLLGLNFVPASSRFLSFTQAQEIMKAVPAKGRYVGVFQDEIVETLLFLAESLSLDYVQLHGNDDLDVVREAKKKGLSVIKAFNLSADFDLEELAPLLREYQPYVSYFLFDREKQGEGDSLNLQSVRELTHEFDIILAGGLNPENVTAAVTLANPIGVDVAGGVETKGEQDMEKVRQFITNATA